MSVALANGVALHVQELGAAGPPVAMLHGLLVGTLAAWYFTAAPALARSHRVLLYDLRGHGRSERASSGYDVRTMAADLAALLARYEEPVSLVGHSYGALVALRFALDSPSRVARLALVEAPLPASRFGELAAAAPGDLLSILPAPLREGVAGGGRRAARFLASIDFLIHKSSLQRDVASERDVPDEDLARLAMPVLCVYGASSICKPVGERLARVVPGARLVVLPGGHFLHLDAPTELTRVLMEFLDG